MKSSMTPVRRTVAMTVWAVAWAGLLTAALTARQAPAAPPAPAPAAAALQAPDAFETRIRPLLAANCYACHGETAMGGLRLDTREGFFKGSDAGPIVEPGKPDASTLLKVVQHAAGYPAMPKGRAKLAPADIDVLTEWVRLGAVWPAPATAAATPVASHAKAITAEQRAFWSFAPLAASPPPSVRDSDWPATDIDRHVLAAPRSRGPASGWRRRQADAAAPRDHRPHRPAAHARGDRRVRRRQFARGVRKGRRSAARLAALRRDVGTHVARRGALRRGRLPEPRPDGPRLQPVSQRAPLSRLGHPRLQRRPALRPVRDGAARRRPAAAGRACAPSAGLGLPGPRALVLRQRRGRDHPRRRAARPGRRGEPRPARPHRRLRPLPRPQVRPDSHHRLLRARRRVPEHRVPRVPAGAEGRRRGVQGQGEGAQAEARDARGVPAGRSRAARRHAGVRVGEVHEGGVAGQPANRRRTRRRSSSGRSSTTSCSTAGSSS